MTASFDSSTDGKPGIEPVPASVGAMAIWAKQIENARQQTETAVVKLAGLFDDIVAKLDVAIDASQRDSAGNANEAAQDGEQAQSKLSQVIDDLRDAQKGRELLNQEITSIVSYTDSLQKMAEEVKVIAFKTNILSINAAIEAAHAGSIGRGFAIVAAEVRALSTASRSTGQDINQTITAINKALRRIAAQNETVTGSDRATIERSERNIQAVLQRQRERVEQFIAAAGHTQRQNSEIKANIEDALVHLQFQDRVSQILMQLAAAISAADQLTGELAGQDLDEMANSYTTDEQRRIHAGQDVEAAAPQEVTYF